MKTLERIVVGIDLEPDGSDVTPGTRRAVDQARSIAQRSGASVCLFHSTARDEYFDPLGMHWVLVGHGVPEGGHAAMEALLAELREAGVECEIHLTDEKAWLALTHEALRERADLVIVGKRTRDERDGRKLGRVSKKLLRKCPSRVWVTQAGHEQAVRTIVAATDLTEVGERVLDDALWLSRELEATLHVVHAVPVPQPSIGELQPGVQRHFLEDHDRAMRTAREKLEERLAWADPELVHVHVIGKGPYDAIRQAVESHEADLLVLGTISRSGIAGFLIGNTAEALLDKVDCSILAVKPEGFVSPVKLAPPD